METQGSWHEAVGLLTATAMFCSLAIINTGSLNRERFDSHTLKWY